MVSYTIWNKARVYSSVQGNLNSHLFECIQLISALTGLNIDVSVEKKEPEWIIQLFKIQDLGCVKLNVWVGRA